MPDPHFATNPRRRWLAGSGRGASLAFLIATILIALMFDFTNGFHDTANAVATSISTRVLPARFAIVMAACLNFLGAFISTQVAKTIGTDVAQRDALTPIAVMAALLAAIGWNLLTWYYGLPSSSSHALIGGLMGAAVVQSPLRFGALKGQGIFTIVLSLILSPDHRLGRGLRDRHRGWSGSSAASRRPT